MNQKKYCTVACALTFCFLAMGALGQTITNFTPTFGKAGSTVRVYGSGFVVNSTKIYFNGTPSPSVKVTATTQLEATVPTSMTPGLISVQVGNGTPSYSQASFTNIGNAPFIVDFTPYSGAGGSSVTLTGANFTGTTSVKFAGVAASFTPPTTDTQLKVTAPNNVLTGPITVTTAQGSYSTWINFYGKPAIASFSPWNGRRGTNVTILGTNFLGTTSVTFNGVPADFTVVSNNKITTTVPDAATKGAIIITTPSMPYPTSSNFVVLPTITDFNPKTGPVGTLVTIQGTNLKLGNTNPVVSFNGNMVVATNSTSTQLIVPVPNGAVSGSFTVTTKDGVDTSSTIFMLPPNVTNYTPIRAMPGTTVTLTGVNFTNATAIAFAGTNAQFTVINNTNATAVVPIFAKTGPLTLTTPAGTSTPGRFFIPPVITDFNPKSAMTNAAVTITGIFPDGLTNVLFNGVSAMITNISTNTVIAYVPTNATTGPIMVKSAGGTNTTADNFQLIVPLYPPQISSFSPTFGPVGTLVTITGTNLNFGTVTVQFAGTTATPVTTTATQITVKAPKGAVSGPITVTGRDGAATTANSFLLPPVISGFTPTNGGVGDTITVTGTNFINATSLRFNSSAATFKIVNNNTITATVPELASSGPIRLITPAGTNDTTDSFIMPPSITSFSPTSGVPGVAVTVTGIFPDGATSVLINGVNCFVSATMPTYITITVPTNAGTGPITVVAKGGTVVSTNSFTSIVPVMKPVITSFTPTMGPVGTHVTLKGTNLNRTPVTVKFNTTTATPTSLTSNQIVVSVPAGASSGPLTVTTKDGSYTTDTIFRLPPTITGFQPTSALPGSSIFISGVDFTNATEVTFNGVLATYRVVNNEQIIATVPTGASSGNISITTPAGAITSTSLFMIPPVITTFSPASGAIGTTVTLVGFFPDTATNVLFNGVAGTITLAGTSQIQATVPTNATTGPITLQALGGSDQSLESFIIAMPQLFIARGTSNTVNIQWTGAAAYVLQYLTNLNNTNLWLLETNTTRNTNGVNTVTTPATGGQRFFRLKNP